MDALVKAMEVVYVVKAVGYLRVSQKDENVENQRMKILEYAERNGIEIMGFFKDEDISGDTRPRDRENYRAMLEFCRINGIKLILFYDLSRLARNVEYGLEELKNLAEEGIDFRFVAMDFLNYISDPMMKKKVIMDFLWFAEVYLEDVRRRTRVAMERLKQEGKVFHRPRLSHYVALWLKNKESFRELDRRDIEEGERYLFEYIRERLGLGKSLKEIHREFVDTHTLLYRKYKVPKSYLAFWREWRRLRRRYTGVWTG